MLRVKLALLLILGIEIFSTVGSFDSLFFTPDQINRSNSNPANLEKMEIKKLKTIYPIVYLNALMGHSLEAKLENVKVPNWFCYKNSPFYQLWLNVKYYAFQWSTDCAVNVIKPVYNSKLNRMVNKPGVTVRPKDFGGINGLNYIDIDKTFPYFNVAIKYLEKLGYEVGKSFRSGAFDWRKGATELLAEQDLENIKKLIEETYTMNGDKKIHLMGHSYGGPVGNFFLSDFVTQEWKNKYIKSFIPYGSPYDGSASTMLQLLITTNRGPTHVNKAFSEIARSLSSTTWLLPQSIYWKDKLLMDTPKRKYYGNDIIQYFKDYNMTDAIKNFANNQKYLKNKPPNVPVNCFYGSNIQTATGYRISENNQVQRINFEDGDGTVPLRGLKTCDSYSRRQDQKKYPVKVFEVNKLSHGDVSSELFLISLNNILNQ
jgi:hypothetical protein